MCSWLEIRCGPGNLVRQVCQLRLPAHHEAARLICTPWQGHGLGSSEHLERSKMAVSS